MIEELEPLIFQRPRVLPLEIIGLLSFATAFDCWVPSSEGGNYGALGPVSEPPTGRKRWLAVGLACRHCSQLALWAVDLATLPPASFQ